MNPNATPYVREELASLSARFPGYDFWHVPTSHGPDHWCWKPKEDDYGTASQHRASPEQVAAAITGTEGKRRAPARTHPQTEAAPG